MALVTLTAVAAGVTYTNHAALLPLVARDFALSDVQAGLVTTALFLPQAAAMLGSGGIAERAGPKRVVAAGLALALLGNVLFGEAPSYATLLLAKAVTGLGAAFAFIAGTRYVAGLYGERRSHFGVGLYGAGFPLGSALALWAMPPLALLTDWRGAFRLSSAAFALVVLIWLLTPPVGARRPPGTLADAARNGNVWWTFVQHAAGFGLVLAAGTWITVYLLREFALPLALAGALGSLLLVVAVVARSLGGWLLARRFLGSRAVMAASQLLILGGIALLALPGRPLAFALLGAFAVGLGAGLPYAAVFNTSAASLPSAPGSAQGITAVGGTGGALIGAPAMGYAVQNWGFGAAWAVLATFSLAALAGAALMRGEEELPSI